MHSSSLVSLDAQLYLLASGDYLSYPSPHYCLETLIGNKLEQQQLSVFHLSEISALYCLMSSVLKTVVLHILPFGVYCGWKIHLVPITSLCQTSPIF